MYVCDTWSIFAGVLPLLSVTALLSHVLLAPFVGLLHRMLARIKEWCGPGAQLSEADVLECARIVESGQEHLRNKQQAMVKEYCRWPMLRSYSSDGTPIQSRRRFSAKAPVGGSRVRRSGRGTDEWLVQHQFTRVLTATGHKSTVLLAEPLALTEGKGAPQALCGLL